MSGICLVLVLFALTSRSVVQAQETPPEMDEISALGKALFFDPNLSVNGMQSLCFLPCARVGFHWAR